MSSWNDSIHYSKLTFFGVGLNRLSRRIPPSIFNLSSLQAFDVGSNQIQGHLPTDISITLQNIRKLNIGFNQFTRPFPISISNASNLIALQFLENKLSGRVPSSDKLNRISVFVTSNNELGIIIGNGGENDMSFLCSLKNATYLKVVQIQF